MITYEMKLTENYRLYDEVFGVDVPTTQSQLIESTQGTHKTTSAPRTPNPEIAEGESEHLMDEEIKKLVKGSENVEENVEVASSLLKNDENQSNPGTRLEPRSNKERPEVEKIIDISQPINVIEKEEESAEDDYELK
ncbi:hypothetical protein Tco_1046369 [Tanacetum coccineum]